MKIISRPTRHFPLQVFGFLVALCFTANVSAAQLKEARVTQVFKDVKLLPSAAAAQPATVNDDVRENTAVRTGVDSRSELTFTDKTLARLGANTIFTFEQGTRSMELGGGAMLLRVPKGAGGAQIRTAAVTAAITGTTVMLEYHKGGVSKLVVLEGTAVVGLVGSKEKKEVKAGEMMAVEFDAQSLPDPFEVDLSRIMETAQLVVDFPPLESLPLITREIEAQQAYAQTPPDKSLVLINQGNEPDLIDAISKRTDATSPGGPTPTPTPSGPSKFGIPEIIVAPAPYVIGSGTTIQTDPTITTNGVTDFGKIYRGHAIDGPASVFFFGNTSVFDALIGFNALVSDSGAVFKFQGLQLAGNPTISTLGGELALGLISVGDITSGGPGGALTFAGLQGLLIATQSGSILLGPEISFAGLQELTLYARGSGSNLILGAAASTSHRIDLFAEGDIQVNGAQSTDLLRVHAGHDFLAGSGAMRATGAIDLRAGNNVNFNFSQFVAGTNLGFTLTLAAGNLMNINVSGNQSVFTNASSILISGLTINLTGNFGTLITLDNALPITLTAGAGGLQANGVGFVGGNLTLVSGGDIHIFSATIPLVMGSRPVQGSIAAAGLFDASGDVTTSFLQTGTSVNVGGGLEFGFTLNAGTTVNVGGELRGATLTAGGDITAGRVAVQTINAPSGILSVGAGGIIPFLSSPAGASLPHVFTLDSIVSLGGINFSGGQFAGLGNIFSGGLLTINANTLVFAPAGGIAFASFNGADGSMTLTGEGGSGGTFIVNAAGEIAVGADITATTGLNSGVNFGGTGGTVQLHSSGSRVSVNSRIEVSSNAGDRRSASGGHIGITSDVSDGSAISIGSSAQLLSLLDAGAAGPGGSIILRATGNSSVIDINNDTGEIRADRGLIDIRQLGNDGVINLANANLRADVIKIGALGSNGTLTITGGMISADTLLRLYAGGSNGSIIFAGDVTLSSQGLAAVIAAHMVTILDGFIVTIGGPSAAQVFADVANYSATFGGNGSTTGTFGGMGASTQPFVHAPPFDSVSGLFTATYGGTVGGNWSNPGSWMPMIVPNNGNGGFTFNAVMGNGTLTQDIAPGVTIERLFMNGGTLILTHPLSLNAGLQFTSGAFTFGTLNIAGSSTQSALMTVNNTTINNSGDYNLTLATGNIFSGAASVFNNSGTFRVSGGGMVNFTLALNNMGAVNVNNGTLVLAGGSPGTTTGDFNVAAGAALNFNSNFTLGATSDLAGAGTINFIGGAQQLNGTYTVPNLNLNGSALTSNITLNVAAFNFLSGQFQSALPLSVSGLFSWSGGTLSGGGVLNANGGITLNSAGVILTLDGKILNNLVGSTATWIGDFSGQDRIALNNGAVFNNHGSFFAHGDMNIFSQSGGGVFNNFGTFTRDVNNGPVLIQSGVQFNNSGTVNVQSGSLSLNGGDNGSTTGDFNVAAATQLFFSGNFNFAASSDFAGLGRVFFNGGTQSLNGTFTVPDLVINGSTLTSNIPLNLTTLNLTNSILGGSGTVNVSGFFTWNGGTIRGSGVTNANGTLSLESTGVNLILDGRTLNLASGQIATWTDTAGSSGGFGFFNGSTFNNNGTFLAQGDQGLFDLGGGGGTFNNGGTFIRNNNAAALAINIAFNNSGTVRAESGTMVFNGQYAQTAGSLELAGGNIQSVPTLSIQGGLLTGFGSITAAIMNNAMLRPGLAPGGLVVNGNVSLLGASQLVFNLGGLTQGTQYGFMNVNGVVTLGGQLVLSFVNGFQNTITGGNTFTLLSSSNAFIGAFTNIVSGGRLTTSDGFGSFLVTYSGSNLILSNYLVTVTNAIWTGGSGNWSGGANWNTNPNFPNNGQPGAADLYNATLNNGGTITRDIPITIQRFTMTGGAVTGANPLTMNQLFTWQGGTLSGTGAFNANGGLLLDGGSLLGLDGTTLNIPAGQTTTDSGLHDFGLSNSSVINNAGIWLAQNNVGIDTGGGGTFNNTGTFTRNTGTGVYFFSSAIAFNNNGIINANSGTLGLLGGGTSTGTFTANAGAILNFDGVHNLNGATVSGAGAVQISGGAWNLNAGTYNVTGATTVSGGAANFNINSTTNLLNVVGGTLGGSGNLTSSGLLTWSAGTIAGSGVINANGGVSLSGNGGLSLFGRTLNNAAGQTATLSGTTTSLNFGNGALFNNNGSFLAQSNGGFGFLAGAGNSFNNAGTFTRNTGTGTFTVGGGVAFNNSGTVNVQTGTLTFNGGYAQTAGTLDLAGGSLSSNSALQLNGGLLTGFGTLNAAIMNNAMLRPGLAPGGLVVNGNVSLLGSSQLIFQLGGLVQGTQYGFLNVNGVVTLGGQLVLSLVNGFQTTVTGGNTFTLLSSSNAFIGAFTNIVSGSRLDTSDGFGSFVVTYSGNNLILSNFLAAGGVIPATWTGGSGNWSGGANWNINPNFPNNGQPGAADLYNVTLANGGTITLNLPITIENFTLSNGTITGANPLTVNQLFTWSGGTLTGGVTVNANGGTLLNSSPVSLDGSTLNNSVAGQIITVSGAGRIGFSNGAIINNVGTFLAQNDLSLADVGGGGTFNNIGTFTRNTGVGTFTIGSGVVFNNTGTVNVNSGALVFSGGDTGSTTGDFNVAAAAALGFLSNFTFAASSDFSGAGIVFFNGGAQSLNGTFSIPNVTINGSTLTSNISLNLTTLNLTSGTFSSAQPLTIGGLFSWNGGTISGGGVVNANGGISFLNGGSLVGSTLNHAIGQTATLGGTANLFFGGGGIFNNNGTFLAQGTGGLLNGGGGTFNNAGTFTRDTSGGGFTVDIGVVFNNTGIVNVNSGSLVLNGGDGGATLGDFNVASGAQLSFSGNFNFTPLSDFTGLGTVFFNGGMQSLNGTFSIPNLRINGSVLSSTIALDLATFNLVSGSFSSPQPLNVSGLFTWNSGSLIGPGSVNANGGISMPNGSLTLDNNTLSNAVGQTATLSNSLQVIFQNNAVMNNHGTFLAQTTGGASDGFVYVGGGAGAFNNFGTFTRNTGATDFVIGPNIAFNNSGTVNINSGITRFNGGYTQTAGTLQLGGGSVTSTTTLQIQGGLLTGFGNIGFSGISNNGMLRPGLAAGGLNVFGNVSLLGASQLVFNLGGLTQGAQYGFMNVNGVVTLGGQLVLSFVNGFQTTITGGNTFTLMSSSNAFIGAFTNIVSGSRLDTSDGFGSFVVTYSGSNLILSNFLASGGVIPATWTGASGNWSTATNWDINPNFPNNGQPGVGDRYDVVVANGGTVTLNLPITIEKFTLTNGTLTGANTLTTNDLFTLSNGTLAGGLTLNANGGVLLNGVSMQLDGATLNNATGQTATLNGGGGLFLSNGTALNNNGTFLAQGDQFFGSLGGAVSTFNNAGTFTRATGAGTFIIQGGTIFNNTGTVNVNTGSLRLNVNDPGSTTGDFNIAAGATLIFAGDFSLAASSDLAGAGTVIFQAGTQQVNGTYSLNNINVTGGLTLFNIAANVATINLATGSLSGTGTLSASGLFTWTSGGLLGNAVFNANGGILLNGSGVILSGRTLNNALGQTATLSGGAQVFFDNGAIFNNNGTFLAQNDQFFGNLGGGTFNNSGTFTRDTGAGTFSSNIPFNNSGTVNANSGTLLFNGAYTQTGGTTQLAGGNISSGGVLQIQGGLLTGFGAINAPIVNNAMLRPGLAPGGLTVMGNVSLLNSSQLIFQLGGLTQGSQYAFMGVNGVVTLGGQLVLSFVNNFQSTITGGDSFNLMTSNNSFVGAFTNIVSGGRLLTSDGAGSFAVIYNGNQLILANFMPSIAVTSNWIGAAGGNWSDGTQWSTSPGSPNNGQPGPTDVYDVVFNNGTSVTLDVPVTIQRLALSNGTITGGNSLTINQLFTWSGGTLSGTGVTNANGGIVMNGATLLSLEGRTLNNAVGQIATLSGGAALSFQGGAIFNNNGTFLAQTDAGISSTLVGGTFNNSGTLTRDTGAGVFAFGPSIAVNNSGLVSVNSGTLEFNGGYAQSVGTLDLAGGNVGSSGTLQIQGGQLSGFGTINAAISNNAMLRPGLAPGGLMVNGNVSLLGASQLFFNLGGLTQGSQYGFLHVTGMVTLGGNLGVSFVNGFIATNPDSFTVLSSSTPLTGVFANVASGGRLSLLGAPGSVLVTYSGNTIVFSDYNPALPIPPSTPPSGTNGGGNGGFIVPPGTGVMAGRRYLRGEDTSVITPHGISPTFSRVAAQSRAGIALSEARSQAASRVAAGGAINLQNSTQLLDLLDAAESDGAGGRVTVRAARNRNRGRDGGNRTTAMRGTGANPRSVNARASAGQPERIAETATIARGPMGAASSRRLEN